MEVFVLDDNLTGFLNVRRSLLAPTGKAEREFGRRHRGVRLRYRVYDDAGGDVIRIQCPTLADFQRLLDDPQVTAAAARLVLDVMRKHFCRYTRNHCPQVVQSVYPDHPRQDVSSARSVTPSAEAASATPVPIFEEGVAADDDGVQGAVSDTRTDDPGDVVCYWIVTQGRKESGHNRIRDFLARGEWRMDPKPRFEDKVADMLPGERIAVQSRRNVVDDDIPFDRRGNRVSVMDFHLTGTITANPGDGCSVSVAWDPIPKKEPRYYLYTSQDTVWRLARGFDPCWDDLIGFVFDGKPQQNIDALRNAGLWAERFGDR